jgi:hypothetical protein
MCFIRIETAVSLVHCLPMGHTCECPVYVCDYDASLNTASQKDVEFYVVNECD